MCFTQVITLAAAQVGRAPWPAWDALVPLLEAAQRPQCASHTTRCTDRTHLSQAHAHLKIMCDASVMALDEHRFCNRLSKRNSTRPATCCLDTTPAPTVTRSAARNYSALLGHLSMPGMSTRIADDVISEDGQVVQTNNPAVSAK